MGVGEQGDGTRPHGRLPSLTSLRWFAATAVFLRHAALNPHLTQAGATGVSFFFVLSGFVLTWSFRKDQSTRDFAVRRLARIYPSYAFVAVFSIPILMAVDLINTPAAVARGLFNLSLLQSWIPRADVYYAGNGVSWSVADEAFFYALFPILMVGFLHLTGRSDRARALWVVAVAMVAVGVVVPLVLHPAGDDGTVFWFIYINPAFRLIEFVLGMCVAHLFVGGHLPRLPLWPCALLAAAAFVAAGYVPRYLTWSAMTIVPFSLLIVAAVQADVRGETNRMLRSRTMILLGTWSFAFYLVHTVVLAAARGIVDRSGAEVPAWSMAAAAYGASIVASYLLYRFIEHPNERRVKTMLLSTAPPTRPAVP